MGWKGVLYLLLSFVTLFLLVSPHPLSTTPHRTAVSHLIYFYFSQQKYHVECVCGCSMCDVDDDDDVSLCLYIDRPIVVIVAIPFSRVCRRIVWVCVWLVHCHQFICAIRILFYEFSNILPPSVTLGLYDKYMWVRSMRMSTLFYCFYT